jgi:hypothetical protein
MAKYWPRCGDYISVRDYTCLHRNVHVYQVTTSRRRVVASLSRCVDASTYADEAFIPPENTVARSEMDNHADTTCFGSNFTDPFNPHRDLTIHDLVTDTLIPMEMVGTVAYLTTRAPTWQEFRDCPHVIMTDDKEWDPSTLDLRPRSKEEEYTRIVSSVRTVSKRQV